MSWKDVPMKELKEFFSVWRSRKEFMDKYDLSNTSSYHAFKHFARLKSDFISKKTDGKTRSIIMIKIKD